jgi:hypothetical protein
MSDNWLIDREAVQANFGALDEEQWSKVTEEIAGRVDNFIEEIIAEVIEKARN